MAQSESGLLLEAEAEKKLSKKFSVGLEADMRTRNDFKTMDRWSIGIGGEYKPVKQLKLGAGYTLLNTNFREDISYKADGNYNNWRPSYWGVRHRFNVSASGTYKFRNNLRISLRERTMGLRQLMVGRQGTLIQGQEPTALTPASGIR